jgi:hypothetical protein
MSFGRKSNINEAAFVQAASQRPVKTLLLSAFLCNLKRKFIE